MQPAWELEFAEFFAAAALPLRRTAWGICGDWQQAEDIVQTAFVRVYAKFPKIKNGNPLAYTRRTVINLCLSRQRGSWREVLTDEPPDQDVVPAPESVADVGAALGRLPQQQRAVVVLRFIDDLPVREVAELLGISEGTVKSHSHRALNAMRGALSDETITEESR